MTKIKANFADVHISMGVIPDDEYECYVKEVKSDKTTTGKDRETIIAVVDDPDPDRSKFNGKQLWDRLVLTKNDGNDNEISLARIKEYGIAILGEEAANGEEMDTADFINGRFIAVVGHDDWEVEKKDAKGKVIKDANGKPEMKAGTSNVILRVLPVE